MNRLIKAVVLASVLLGIAVYILVSSMPGRSPEEKMKITRERTSALATEVKPQIEQGRVQDLLSSVKGYLGPPRPEEFPGESFGKEPPMKPKAPSAQENAEKTAPAAKPAKPAAPKAPTETCSDPEPVPEPRPLAVVHTVKPGETLWAIAKAYYGDGKHSHRIMESNGLTSDVIRVGQKLKIPSLGRKTKDVGRSPEEPASRQDTVHVVALGETLYRLAKKYYGHSRHMSRIREANPDADFDNLSVGCRLVIPRAD